MQKINTADGLFEDGNPSNGGLGTIVTAAWLNMVQAEVISVLTAAGIAVDGAKSDQLATAIQTLLRGKTTVDVTGGASVALTAAQYGKPILVLNGALTANINLIFPAISGAWIVRNQTTGNFTVTCKTQAGTGVVVSQGCSNAVWGDGTNIYAGQTDWASIQAQTATAFTSDGVSPNFTLTPSPALTAYAPDRRYRVKFHAATSSAATLNVSDLGGKPLKQYDAAGAKVNAVIAAGQLADVEFDGVDFVILDPLPPATGVKGDDMASAATVNLGAATGDYVTITGAIAITSFGVAPAGTKRTVVFSASLTLTHSANLLLNANGANIITAANDVAEFRSEGGGVWRCADYTRADGKPLSGSGGTNGMGTRYISTASPTGGVDGDIWYKV